MPAQGTEHSIAHEARFRLETLRGGRDMGRENCLPLARLAGSYDRDLAAACGKHSTSD